MFDLLWFLCGMALAFWLVAIACAWWEELTKGGGDHGKTNN